MKKVLDEILSSNGLSLPNLSKLAGRGEASIYGFSIEAWGFDCDLDSSFSLAEHVFPFDLLSE
jgi:hypothetical protein